MASKGSGSEDDPLVPDDFDDEFLKNLLDKVPEITKVLRQKSTPDNADNVQRLVICCNRYKSDLRLEQARAEELRGDITRLEERLEGVSKLSKLDQDTIAELRNVIESAWKQKDAAQLREQVAHDELLKLRENQETLEASLKQLSDKRSLQSKRDEDKERDKLRSELKELNKRMQIQRIYTNEVEAMTQTLEEKNKALVKLLDETSTEAYNSKKRIDVLQKELQQRNQETLKQHELIGQFKSQNEQLTKVKVRQNLQLLSLRTNLEHLNTQYNGTCNKLAKITVELEYAQQERDKNKLDLVQRSTMLKVREDEIIKLKQENAQTTKTQESTARKYATLDEAKRHEEEKLLRLKTQLNTQDKELEAMQRLLHQFEQQNVHLTKERDVLKHSLREHYRKAESAEKHIQNAQQEIKSLKDTIAAMEAREKKFRENYKRLQKEKMKKMEEIQTLLDKLDALHKKLRLSENYVIEQKRTVEDLESSCAKLKVQHIALQGEKSGLQRIVQTVEEDKEQMRHQLATLQGSIDSMQTQLTNSESEISRLLLQIEKMEKERRALRAEILNLQLSKQHTRAELDAKKKDNDHCTRTLKEGEQMYNRIKQELDNVRNEKNNVGAQLTKRHDEYDQLKSRLDNLQAEHDQTQKSWTQAQDDLRLLRVEVKNLRTERDVLRKDRESAADLRQEMLQMHRVLNQERIKARALQEEMVKPMNVHRWRNLSGKDPEKMDLIHTIQALRKQLLSKEVAALEQERALSEAIQLYRALKEFMDKLPTHKVKAELNEIKENLNGKNKQLKALKAELVTKQADEKMQNMKLEDLKATLSSAQSLLTQERKKNRELWEQRQIINQLQEQCLSAPAYLQHKVVSFKALGKFGTQ